MSTSGPSILDVPRLARAWAAQALARRATLVLALLAFAWIGTFPAFSVEAAPLNLTLRAAIEVDSQGVFLDQLIEGSELPARLRVADAPALGKRTALTQAQLVTWMQKEAPELAQATWRGAAQVTIARRYRKISEAEIKDLLLSALQRDHVKERGQLELRLQRPWAPTLVPDEPLRLVFTDLPSSGVGANFIARFELRTDHETAGTWQIPLQARVWREIWVARGSLARGELLREADVALERRDVLALRDFLTGSLDSPALRTHELVLNVPMGNPLVAHQLRPRPLVRRGQVLDAILRERGMTVSLKVEVMENGIAGQTVRVRNPQSRREFRGKVEDEQTIIATL